MSWSEVQWFTGALAALFVGLTIFQLWTGKTINRVLDLLDRADYPVTYIYTVCLTSFGSIFLLSLLFYSLFDH